MGSRRYDSRERRERLHDYDSGDERRERGRDYRREWRADERRGGSADSYERKGFGEGGGRQVRCYECNELGYYKSQCPRLQVRTSGGLLGGTVALSKELEESLSVVGRMAKQLIDQQKVVEDAKGEAEEKLKKEAEEKAAKEEAARVEMAKKKAKEDKEQRRKWEIKKLLAEQREEYETKLEKIIRRGIKGVTIDKKKKSEDPQQQPSSSSESDEDEDEQTPLKDKKKRRDSTGDVANSPPVETPSKQGKHEELGTPSSMKKKGRGAS
ncbi:hypothetical protein CBR_g44359 [Chara braunii]|uniref:CCHC-type domain-containing protein n=1 Tax=Chara braunii TaxID=69332 RepID=A0A388LXB8_CHABU|nr:hypothetical protein CBR_g44359 [Chara braunii]|eukprot:GBG86903.1 hypothetical protein CBR_g44359 [Chara braunii]